MIGRVDMRVISDFEGGQRLFGYVPQKGGQAIGNSGVTIATGVDVGQMSEEDIKYLPIGPELKDKLRPYLEITGEAAIFLLKKKPLSISKDEADALDDAVHSRIIRSLQQRYDRESQLAFKELPARVQTCLASMAVNRGPAFGCLTEEQSRWWEEWREAWRLALTGQWAELRFHLNTAWEKSSLHKRRMREAELLNGL